MMIQVNNKIDLTKINLSYHLLIGLRQFRKGIHQQSLLFFSFHFNHRQVILNQNILNLLL